MNEALILAHLPLVRAIALRVRDSLPAFIDLEDLVGAGCVGLIEAAAHHDESLGSFAAFARFRIRGEMLDLLRRNDHVTRGGRDFEKRVARARRQLAQILGRYPDSDELAASLGLEVADYGLLASKLGYMAAPQSLEGGLAVNGQGEKVPIDQPDDRASSDAGALHAALAADLAAARRRLTVRQGQVLRAMYDDGLAQHEVAAALGLTEGRVSQIHSAAMRKLHYSLKAAGYS